MTDQPVPRFVVRKGSIEGAWMVWDRKTRRPAMTDKGVAAGLTEKRAHAIRDLLMRVHMRGLE